MTDFGGRGEVLEGCAVGREGGGGFAFEGVGWGEGRLEGVRGGGDFWGDS